MSDRVAVFHDGVLQQVATPQTLYDEPGKSFVAGFVGENNLLPCRLVQDSGRPAALVGNTVVPGVLPVPVADGAETVLAIRPERIGLVPSGMAGSFPCTVAEAFFLGDHVRVYVTVPALGGTPILVKQPPSSEMPPAGAQAAIDLPAAHCRILAP